MYNQSLNEQRREPLRPIAARRLSHKHNRHSWFRTDIYLKWNVSRATPRLWQIRTRFVSQNKRNNSILTVVWCGSISSNRIYRCKTLMINQYLISLWKKIRYMLKIVKDDIENMVKIQRTLQYLTRLSQHKQVMAKRFHFEVHNETVFRFKKGSTFFTHSKLHMYEYSA
jgi:hypothetical protein